LLLGFGVPVLQLLAWAVRTGAPTGRLGALAAASLGLAATATFFTLGLAILVAYSARLGGNRPAVGMSLHPVLTIAATSGYAVPAAVLAVGVAATFSWIDRNLIAVADATLGVSLPLLTTGTIVALVAAYVVRFFALGHNGAEAGMAQVSRRFDDVARSLGAGPGRTMLRAVLPPARPALTAAAVLLVVEVLKELPLTLILRPLNVNTLATEVFRFAGTEQVAESAVYSLIIIAIGALAVPILSARSAGN
jgi:iron(III) transport system permease protein